LRADMILIARIAELGGLGFGGFEVAFPEVKRDLVKRALLPLFGFRQPEHPALGIPRSALSAHEFLVTDFHQLFHELHSRGVKPIDRRVLA
jgi:hypothetical protein